MSIGTEDVAHVQLMSRDGCQWLMHHGTGEKLKLDQVGPEDPFTLQFGSCGTGVLTNASSKKLVSQILQDKLINSSGQDSFPVLKVETLGGVSEFHAVLRCRNVCRCVKLQLMSHPPFFGEVYLYPVHRGTSYLLWSMSWIRKLIFPDDVSDNFVGRHIKTWNPFLLSAGLEGDNYFVHSHHAAKLILY